MGIAESGDCLHLQFKLLIHGVANLISVMGVVRTKIVPQSAGASDSVLCGFGLEFLEIPLPTQMLIKSFIYQNMIDTPECMA